MDRIIQEEWPKLKAKGAVVVFRGEKVTGGRPTGRKAIVVGVKKKLPLSLLSKEQVIPRKIRGIKTDVLERDIPMALGAIPKLQEADPERVRKHRPAFGGISVGHPEITAGTLGGMVWQDGASFGITNWHVGNMNDGQFGDPMWQPGKVDGGSPEDILGPIYLKPEVEIGGFPLPSECPWFKAVARAFNALGRLIGSRTYLLPVKMQAANLVDMCLIGPLELGLDKDIIPLIYEIGTVNTRNWVEAVVGMSVEKSGRTSAVLEGEVQAVGASVTVGLGGILFADFHDQLLTSPFSEPGDSGSLVLERNTYRVVGLLFAGSDQMAIANRWANVKEIGRLD